MSIRRVRYYTYFFKLTRGLFANFIPVTLVNIRGGAVFIGATYWFVAHDCKSASQKETTIKVANEKITAKG